MKQLTAGYIIDNLLYTIGKDSEKLESAKELAKWLSHFQVNSKTRFEENEITLPSNFAVLINLLQRGTPTRLNKFALDRIVENSKYLGYNAEKEFSINVNFQNIKGDIGSFLFRCLHIIDPRINRQSLGKNYQQSWEELGSKFEEGFIYDGFPRSLDANVKNEGNAVIQLLSAQREISNIIKDNIDTNSIEDKLRQNFVEQRTDFSIEFPYTQKDSANGLVIEIDGRQHKQDNQKGLDDLRDKAVSQCNWERTVRITTDDFGTHTFHQKAKRIRQSIHNDYVNNCIKNYKHPLWEKPIGLELLEISLIPFAIARIQRLLLEAMIHDRLNRDAKVWNIAVLERDVPCAKLAIDDLSKLIEKINELSDDPIILPKIHLTVFNTQEFYKSNFQFAEANDISAFNTQTLYDLVIDIAILERSDRPEIILSNAPEIISIRSIHYIDCERKIKTGELLKYKPFCIKNDNTGKWEISNNDVHKSLEYLLQSIFRKNTFWEGQLPIINHALQCKSVIGLLPTGGGKSLTYQLSALLQPGICLVIDPIKSLMQDQVDGLNKNFIDSCVYINSGNKGEVKRKMIAEMAKGKAMFVFISPERLQMKDFRDRLSEMHHSKLFFSYCIIDEAHCVSEWGHDFRTAYLRLGENARLLCKTKNLKTLPLFGLTATASYDVLADVQRELTGNDPDSALTEDSIIRSEYTMRDELQYFIESIELENKAYTDYWALRNAIGKSKQDIVLNLVEEIPKTIESIQDGVLRNIGDFNSNLKHIQIPNYQANKFYKKKNAGLVFCPHRSGIYGVTDKHTAKVEERNGYYDKLQSKPEIQAGYFMGSRNGQADSDEKEIMNNQNDFINNKLNLMVATKAFGMGIDKGNIRYTIHINYPNSIESFVQESGRAGRDKKLALSYILFNGKQVELIKEGKKNFDHDLRTNTYFHEISFKGEEKEYAILDELLGEIHFPTRIFEIENVILINFDLEVKCGLWPKEKPTRLYINLEFKKTFGYIDLRPLKTFDAGTIDKKQSDVILPFVEHFIKSNKEGNTIDWILNSVPKTGIEGVLEKTQNGKDFEVLVGFYNNIKDRVKLLSKWLSNVIHNKFDDTEVYQAKANSPDATAFIENICNKYQEFEKGKELDFQKKCIARDMAKGNPSGYAFNQFQNLYNGLRDKADTEKAIYRLITLGVIDDYTVDFKNQTFTLVGKKKDTTVYGNNLKSYLLKYYSEQATKAKLTELSKSKESPNIRSYLKFLLHFIYTNIKRKREQSIKDMKSACENALVNQQEEPSWLKEYMNLYFNSKYARRGYCFENENGEKIEASLVDKTNEKKIDRLDIVWFFIKVIDDDISGGSEIDNLKHLRGACVRMESQVAESFSIKMLNAYTLYMLEPNQKKSLIEAEELLTDAFTIIESKEQHLAEPDLRQVFDKFVDELEKRKPTILDDIRQQGQSLDFDNIRLGSTLEPLKNLNNTLQHINHKLNSYG